MEGKPLFPEDVFKKLLPVPRELGNLIEECRGVAEKGATGVNTREKRYGWRMLYHVSTWVVVIMVFLNLVGLWLGPNCSLPFIHEGYARMQLDLPRVTEKIALWSPTPPVYGMGSILGDMRVISRIPWSLAHAGKLLVLPLLIGVEPLLLIGGMVGMGVCKAISMGGGRDLGCGIPSFFWTQKNRNWICLPPLATDRTISLGLTWDWQSNSDLHVYPMWWGNLWFPFLNTESDRNRDEFSTVFNDEPGRLGEGSQYGSGRRRLAAGAAAPAPKLIKGVKPGSGKVRKGKKRPLASKVDPRKLKATRKDPPAEATTWNFEDRVDLEQRGTMSSRLVYNLLHDRDPIKIPDSDYVAAPMPSKRRDRSRSGFRRARSRSRSRGRTYQRRLVCFSVLLCAKWE